MNYYANTRQEILELIPDHCKILLDVGCGEGNFGKLFKQQRSNAIAWGVEPVTEVVAKANKNLDRVIHGYFDENSNIPDSYFDIITFNDSLEHFPEPYTPLFLAKKLIKPDGLIITSIPNFRYLDNIKHILFEKDFKYTDEGILDKTHLRFFTLKSMKRLFNDTGLEIIKIQGLNPHWWCGWKIRLLQLLFNKYIEDMKYMQYIFIVRPKTTKT